MEWHLPVQERLAKAVPVRFKYHKDNCMNAFNKPCLFLSHTSKFYSPHPNTNCLAASNAVCTKRNKYSCSCSKMKLIITRRHDHLTSLATRLCCCTKLCLWKNTNNNMNNNNYEYENQFWLKYTYYLILTRGPIIIVKRYSRVILSWRMLFEVTFRCIFY